MRITPSKLLLFLIMIFPVTTVIQGLPLLGNVNRALIVAIIVLMIYSFLTSRITLRSAVIFILMILNCGINMYYTLLSDQIFNINEFFYFPFWIIFMMYFSVQRKKIVRLVCENVEGIRKIVYIWEIIVLVSFVFPSSYRSNWGGAKYFVSFSGGQHRLASTCLMILALVGIIINLSKSKKDYKLVILPVLVTLLTGTRTYLGVVAVFLFCLYYKQSTNKKIFWASIIPLTVIFALFIMVTPMGEKIIAQFTVSDNSYFDAKGVFTNGRTVFWAADLNAFFDLNIFNQIVGYGSSFVYEVNKIAIFDYIWAHNDYINVVMGYGYIGLILYLYTYYWSMKSILREMKCDRILIWGCVLIWFINAMFNMVYTYTCSVLATPFLLFAFSNISEIENDK